MRKIGIVFAFSGLLLAACGSDDPGEPAANPCATPGATYLQTFTVLSGDCPEVPQQILNISNDGTVPAAAGVSCQKIEQDGCRAHNTGCRVTTEGCTTTATTDVTFSADGMRASGLMSVTISCDDGSACAGTYEVTAVRR